MNGALSFLRLWEPEGPWHITAISPDKKSIRTRTFTDLTEAEQWLAKENGKRNLYFNVNPVSVVNKKAEKSDVTEVPWLHVDLDMRPDTKPDDFEIELARIRQVVEDCTPKPTALVFSGGGYQAFWRLEKPLRDHAEAEALNLGLINQLGGDGPTFNVDRIMRLPGTVNLPDARKAAKGRVSVRSELVDFNEAVYPLSDFTPAALPPSGPKEAATTVMVEEGRKVDFHDLKLDDRWNRLEIIAVQGHDPDNPKESDNSRSAWVHDFCCNMVRAGVAPSDIAAVLLDSHYDISESILEDRNPVHAAQRQVLRAIEKVAMDEAEFDEAKTGGIKNNPHNVRLAINRLGITVRHDTFSDYYLISGLPGHTYLQDETVTLIRMKIDERFGFYPGKDLTREVVTDLGMKNQFHPVQDYLDELVWDGTPRLETWLIDYGGAKDTPYVRAVSSLPLIAAVRRIRQPGCKFDEMLVLRSPQGTNKSSALAALCPDERWFTDDLPLNADSQVFIERTAGRWIIEAAELKGMRNKDVEHLKAALSRQVDVARMPYGHIAKRKPRQSIIIGTTNESEFLKDATGNRRFWPVEVAQFEVEDLQAIRDQLWAEAAHREAAGESIRLQSDLWSEAAAEQEAHAVEDPFVEGLEARLGGIEGKIRAADVWRLLGVPMAQRSQDQNVRLGHAMKALGWTRKTLKFGGQNAKCYVKGGKLNPDGRRYYHEVNVIDAQGGLTVSMI